jgi:UDP-glucose 4-epimerase
MGRVVLVTGVCRDVGGRFAARIAADARVDSVVGVDVVPPRQDLGDVNFVRADIRNPVIADILASEGVDTVVHLSVIATPSTAGGRTWMKEINVIGTMQLLAACQHAPGVERLVVKSSSQVYGSSPKDPAVFTEDMTARRLPTSGFAKDSVEVEGYVRGFSRRRRDVGVTVLRCANLIGPAIETTLTRYFRLPVVPTVLGFDPRLQFCHEEDALAALHLATLGPADGTFNIAGDGVLMLSQALRRLGRASVALPAPSLGPLASLLPAVRRAGLSAEETAFLSYGRGLDTTAMREVLGFEPSFTTGEAFEDFARTVRPGTLDASRLAGLEQQIQGWVTRIAADARR